MPVYLDVKSRLDVSAAQLAAREAVRLFSRAGEDAGKAFSNPLGKALGAMDTSALRAQMAELQAEYRRTADVEADAARRMVTSMGQVEVAQRRLSEMTAKYGADSSRAAAANVALADSHARAARAQRDHVDAMVGAEGAAAGLAGAQSKAADSASNAGRVFNAVGIGSVAAFGATMFETTKRAGDFQQSMTKLSAAASVPADQLKTISDGILQMAGKVGYSTGELSNAMFDIAKSGYNGADGLKVLNAAAQGANAEQADLNETVKALTLSMHNFHATPDEAAKVMSQMVTAVGESKVSLNDFAGALHSVEPQAAMLHLSLSDVWGVLSQITASGTSADQAAEQMANTMRSLSGANAPARQAMQQLGIDADDVSQKLGQRGLGGTMQYLYEQTAKKIDPSTGLMNTGELLKSTQAVNDMDAMLSQMSPHARENAEALRNNTMGHREYQMAVRGSNEQDATQMRQFQTLNDRIDGFSKRLSGGRQTLETLNQALNEETGTMSGAAIVMQTTGDHADELRQRTQKIADTVVNADGTVKGFNETQDTLNAKMRDAHAAFGAAEAEIGSAFVPTMMSAANMAKDVGDAMSKHPGIMHGVIDAVGAMAAAWVAFKGVGIISTITGISGALEGMTAAEIAASKGLSFLGAAGPLAAAGAAGVAAAGPVEHGLDHNSWLNDNFRNPIRRFFGMDDAHTGDMDGKGIFSGGYAAGGSIHGHGPKGHDSVLAMLAPGEHVLTHHDVAAMGGHGAVHSFRNALHRAGGGEIPGFAGGGAPGPGGYTQDQAAAAIISAAKARGLSPEQTLAALSTGILETNLGSNSMTNVQQNQSGTVVQGLFQQDSGYNKYGNRTDPNSAARGFVDQFIARGGQGMDPYTGAVKVQVGTYGPGYVRSFRDQAAGYYNRLSGQVAPGETFGGGGIPTGGMPGTGPNGRSGYYTPNQPGVARAQEQVTHLQNEIGILEERQKNLKATATEAERDKLAEELRHERELLAEAEGRLQKAGQGTFHESRGGGRGGRRGGGGGTVPGGLPVPLDDDMGTSGGLPGMARYAVSFLEDLVLAPMENAVMAGINGAGGGEGAGMPGGFSDLGDVGSQIPGAGAAGDSAPPSTAGTGTGAAPTAAPPSSTRPPSTGWGWGLGPHAAAPPPAPARPGRPANIPTLLPGIGGIPGVTYSPTQTPAHVAPTPQFGGLNQGADGGFGNFVAQHPELQGKSLPPGPAPQWIPTTGGIDSLMGDNPAYRADGGPSGTDTVPAWLTPGEDVLSTDDVSAMGGIGVVEQFRNALHRSTGGFVPQYFDGGGESVQMGSTAPNTPATQPAQGQPAAATGQSSQPGPSAPGGAQKQGGMFQLGASQMPGAPGQGESPTMPGARPDSDTKSLPGLATPGADSNSPMQGLPSSPGIGISGGIIGGVEGAASSAGDLFAPGSGAAAQIGFSELNRAASFGAQAAGIGVEGLLETVLPNSSSVGGDWATTIPGRLLTGISGVRPSAANTAGNTTKANGQSDNSGGGATNIGFQLNGDQHVHSNDSSDFADQMQQASQNANGAYPNTLSIGGR